MPGFSTKGCLSMVFAMSVTATACGGDGGGGSTGPDPNAIASVSVTPATATVDIGSSTQLQATARNSAGGIVSTTFSWVSTAPGTASVTSTGLVTGVAEGSATITASAGGRSGSASITVNDPTPPAAPSGLGAVPASETEVDVTWTDNASNEDEFRIERETAAPAAAPSDNQTSVFVVVGTVGPNVTTFRDTGLSPATSYNYRVNACNQNGCSAFSSTVNTTTPAFPPTVTTTALPDAGVGGPYEEQLEATQGDGSYAWELTLGALPPGLALAADGTISGTPTAGGTFDFTVQVTSAEMTGTANLSITVQAVLAVTSAATLPPAVQGQAYSATLTASGGDGTNSWSIESGALPAGMTLLADGTITGTPTQAPPAPASDGATAIAAAIGTSNFTVKVTNELNQSATLAASLTVNEVLAVTTAAFADGTLGVAYAPPALAATGGDAMYTWSITDGDLPPGLALTEGTGAIAGIPTLIGTFDFTVQVADDSGQTATADLSIEVTGTDVVVTTAALPNATLGVAYAPPALAATGGDGMNYTWVETTTNMLPPGLALAADGTITGTPTTLGTFNFTVQASSGGKMGSKDLSIMVVAPVTHTVTVSGAGTGTGTVASDPAGISCTITAGVATGDCTEDYLEGSDVTLTPTADGGSAFTGWSVDCAGTGDCVYINLTADKNGTATFDLAPMHTLTVLPANLGSGEVTSDPVGIDCTITAGVSSGTCAALFNEGVPVELSSAPAVGSVFDGWANAGGFPLSCQGPKPDCTVTLTVTNITFASFQPTPAAETFNIEFRFVAGTVPTAAELLVFDAVEARWEAVLTQGALDWPTVFPGGPLACPPVPAVMETIDDLVIYVEYAAIDGAFGVLARAGPCVFRTFNLLPVLGRLTVDSGDIARLLMDGTLASVLAHEAGHGLGIGTMWALQGLDYLVDAIGSGGVDPHMTGPASILAFDAVGGGAYPGPKVPVEAGGVGGCGGIDAHHRESVMVTELMTGCLNGATDELSVVSIGNLTDFFYATDPSMADPYMLPAPQQNRVLASEPIRMIDDVYTGPFFIVDVGGNLVRLRRVR